MRLAGVVTRGRKRRPITRRDWKSDRRTGARRRVWIGARRRAPREVRPLFLALSAQQMERSRAGDWLAAAAMLAGVASWGVLAALFGA
jgi:hypothetical protein